MAQPTVKATIYYFPGNKENPFGHVAIGGFKDHPVHAPVGYLSYGIGKDRVKDKFSYLPRGKDQKLIVTDITFASENAFYKGCIAISLPPCEAEKFLQGIKAFGERKREDYRLLTNNCANAVLEFLKIVGLTNKDKTILSPVRPQAIALEACDALMADIKNRRQQLLDDKDIDPFHKIHQLITNDIERLQVQIQRDQIAHLSWVKDPQKKRDKISALSKLRDKVEAAMESQDYSQLFSELASTKSLGSKTQKNMNQCLAVFPKELIPQDFSWQEEKKDVKYYKSERHIILNDELDGVDKLKALLENDIHRLEAQLAEDKQGFLTSRLKHPERKDAKIVVLKEFLYRIKEPVDYQALLDGLLRLSSAKDIGKSATARNLQDCIENFPYDKLSNIQEMRNFLIMLDTILDIKVHNSKNMTLFHSVPDGILEMRRAMPAGEDALCAMDEKDVYASFKKVAGILDNNSRLHEHESKTKIPQGIVDLYSVFDLMAAKIERTTPHLS
jgi:cellulose biosynthesis protein BcsQ/uncharacterized small protein (DUF1192 family)